MSNVCLKRLQKELVAIQKNPVANISTTPNESNLLEWHYVIEGPKDTVYEGGYYHGILRFPKDYPYKPPSILMITKNGRFKQNFRLCLSMSDYHPETWNPMWSVSSILQGLLSFMVDNQATMGSMESSDETKRLLAKQSLQENLRNATFCKLFPQYLKLAEQQQQQEQQKQEQAPKEEEEEEGSNDSEDGEGLEPPTARNVAGIVQRQTASTAMAAVLGLGAIFAAIYFGALVAN